MNKIRLFSSVLFLGSILGTLPTMAQTQTVSLKTAKAVGEKMTIIVNKQTTSVDWGDGKTVSYSTDTITGTVKGENIKISGNEYWSMLDCSNCGLTGLNANSAPNLLSLYCRNNSIETLYLTKSTNLVDLDASNNKITKDNLYLDSSTLLQSVNLSNNSLTGSFTTRYFTSLQYLNVANNQLNNLYVTNSTALDMLVCNNNNLTSVDLSRNTSLTSFVGSNNQFSKIALSSNGLPTLIDFVASNNSLDTLNLALSTNVANITCNNNNLSKIVLPMKHKLYSYIVDNNRLSFKSLSTTYAPTNLSFLTQNDYALSDLPNNGTIGRYMFVSTYTGNGVKQLDLSSERYDADNMPYITNWKLYKADDNTLLTAGIDYTNTSGKLTFSKALGKVYLVMGNLKVYDFTVKTEPFTVLAEPTGISSIATDNQGLEVSALNGVLSISAAQKTAVRVFSANGKLIWSGNVDANGTTMNLDKGLYIVNNKKVSL